MADQINAAITSKFKVKILLRKMMNNINNSTNVATVAAHIFFLMTVNNNISYSHPL